ncbi:GHMP kinase, partial [Mesorhizobium sp. M2D.F.Ca.ET.145.01.1.1]
MRATEGRGEAIGHHGELIQGVFEDQNARLHRGLISLPCRHRKSTANFKNNGEERLSVTPQHCQKAKRAAELTLKTFARSSIGGRLTIKSNIPIG